MYKQATCQLFKYECRKTCKSENLYSSTADCDGQHVTGAAAVAVLAAQPAERSAEAAADAAAEHPPHPAAAHRRQLRLQPGPDLLVQPIANGHKRTSQHG